MPVDYPDQSYYERASITLIFRFENFGNDEPLRALAPTTTTKNLDGNNTLRGNLQVVPDPSDPTGRRLLLQVPGTVVSGGPQDRPVSSDGLTQTVTIVPETMHWKINGLRVPQTLEGRLRYIDAPFHPLMIRSIAVKAYMGAITEAQHIAQATGDIPGAPVIPEAFVGPYGEPRTNLRFEGFVDDWETDWNNEDEPMIAFKACDNTRLLLDQEAPPRLVINYNLPLDQGVANYLSNFPQFAGLTIEFQPSTDTAPVPNQVLANTAFRPKLGPQPGAGAGHSQNKLSAWDYIVDLVQALGYAVRVEGTSIVIQRVRSILVASNEQRPDDPWRPRQLATGTLLQYRRMIYGRNIDSIKFRRQFSKHTPTNVEVRCHDTGSKKLLVARFPRVSADPKTASVQLKALPGSTQPDQNWHVMEVYGVSDQATLNRIAQDAYEALGRQELGVELKTFNLSSFGGGYTDPDILDMRFGDTFEVVVNRSDDEVNSLTQMESLLDAQQRCAALFVRLGFSQEFADAYAQAYTNAGFTTLFRLHGLQASWSTDDGISLTMIGMNYIEVRADKDLPPGQEPGNTANTGNI